MILAAILIVAIPVAAAAEDPAAARARYKSGTKHFDLGEFKAALEDFKEAFRLKEDPVILYNIGQCYRLLQDNVEAVRAYRSYLRRAPEAPNRVEVEAKIATLQQAIDSQERATKMPPNQVVPEGGRPPETGPGPTTTTTTTTVIATPPPANTPVYKKWWFWTAIGAVVVVGVGVGLGVGLSSSSRVAPANQFPGVAF